MPQKAHECPATGDLPERQQKALMALLEAPTAREAAKKAGINERTMKKYRADPAFQTAYRSMLSDLLEDAANQSRRNLAGALSALSSIAADKEAPPAARVSAARATIEMSLRLTEQADIVKKLDEFEAWKDEMEGETRK